MKKTFMVYWDGENFITYGEDKFGSFDEVVDFSNYDAMTNGFVWSLSYKQGNQRKYRQSSSVTKSIYAMLDSVKEKLKNDGKVICQTPDIEIHFRSI